MKFHTIRTIRLLLTLIAGAIMVVSCKKDAVIPQSDKIDPAEGAGGTVLTLTGKGLSGIQSIVFDLGNVSADVNPTLNTDNALIFRVPSGANVGPQNIIFKNDQGYQFSLAFTVLAVPSITSAFPEEWEAGSNITINGNYFDNADDVSLEGDPTLKATIVSKTATQLVVTMPSASGIKNSKLIVHNTAGSTTTSIVFTNMDEQLKIYTDGFGSGFDDWSWSGSSSSSDFAVSGTKALKEVYGADGWQGLSFHYNSNISFSDYQSLSFWVKGGTQENQVDIAPDAVASGTKVTTTITVPAGVWTHFLIPVSGHLDGVQAARLNFQIHGPTGITETLYYDNVYLLK